MEDHTKYDANLYYCFVFSTVLDASGYYSGGLMSNISLRPGNPQQCIKLNEILNFGMFQDKIERENILPFKVRVVTAKYNIIMYNVPLKVCML